MGYIDSNGDYIPNTYLDRHNSRNHRTRHRHSGYHPYYSDDIFLPSHLLLLFIGLMIFSSVILIVIHSK